jgi:hypothetical protein
MEDKALDTLRIMLGRRKLETNTERLTSDSKKMEKVFVSAKRRKSSPQTLPT